MGSHSDAAIKSERFNNFFLSFFLDLLSQQSQIFIGSFAVFHWGTISFFTILLFFLWKKFCFCYTILIPFVNWDYNLNLDYNSMFPNAKKKNYQQNLQSVRFQYEINSIKIINFLLVESSIDPDKQGMRFSPDNSGWEYKKKKKKNNSNTLWLHINNKKC